MKDIIEYSQDIQKLCSNRAFELHILPTERCNFRCTYCYETFEKGRMTPETIRAVKQLIDRRAPTLDMLNISWFGGEPMVANDIVMDISAHAARAMQDAGGRFLGSMTTNGWFLDTDRMRKLTNLGVRSFQITLDGPRDMHNQTRVKGTGEGTFDRIWRNLTALRATSLPFKIMIRLHIRPSTMGVLLDWMPELRAELLEDDRFSLLVKPIEHLGGPNDDEIDVFYGDADRHAAVAQFYAGMESKSAYRDDIVGKTCYAGRPNAWVIRSDGRLGRCTVALESDANTVGSLNPDGTLDIDQPKLSPWFKGLAELDPDILGCPAQYLWSDT